LYVLTLGKAFNAVPVRSDLQSQRALWVTGECPLETPSPAEPAGAITMSVFADSGYVVVRNSVDRSRLTFDAGPHGLETLCAHAHADALSVTLSAGDVDIFVDPGTYVYNIHSEARDALRSTAAHNTVVVDETSQSEVAGPFVWLTKTDAVLEEPKQQPWFAFTSGYHDGYGPIRHSRMVLAVADDLWIIADKMCGDAETHTYLNTFTLGEHVHSHTLEGGWLLQHEARTVAIVLMSARRDLALDVRPTTASTRFLQRHATEQLTAKAEARGVYRLITLCYTGKHTPILQQRREGMLQVDYGGRSRYVAMGEFHSEWLHFEGEFLYLECTEEDELDRSFAYGCETLAYRGQDMSDAVRSGIALTG
jgi:hypothetical protein